MISPPSWSRLRGLGSSRLLQSSYFWLLAVPIVVKVLSKIPEAPDIIIGDVRLNGEPLRLLLDLPFSWEMFFYGALFTSIGNLVFTLGCPDIVKRYEDYSDFSEQGRGLYQVHDELKDFARKYWKAFGEAGMRNNLRDIYRKTTADDDQAKMDEIDKFSDAVSAVQGISTWNLKSDRAATLFWEVHERVDTETHTFWRWICFIAYVFGLFFFIYVLVENVLFVLQYSFDLPLTFQTS